MKLVYVRRVHEMAMQPGTIGMKHPIIMSLTLAHKDSVGSTDVILMVSN